MGDLLSLESVVSDPIALLAVERTHDDSALRLQRGISSGVAPGQGRLLLPDRGKRVCDNCANHGFPRDYTDAASNAIPHHATNATADSPPDAASYSGDNSIARTGRPIQLRGPFQLCRWFRQLGGWLECGKKGMVLRPSWEGMPTAGWRLCHLLGAI